MKKIIIQKCKQLEKEHNIKILFCVESGSRVWRINSSDSDYDVRFVYYRPLEEYIQINQRGDVITAHYDKQGNRMNQEGCFLDFNGFDIFKFCKMLSSSNPTTIEWLLSDIEYYGEKPKEFISFAKQQFNPISLYWHYKSMCKQNYLKYLKSGNLVTYKKYLYAMRGLVNAKWVGQYENLPDINFTQTLSNSKHILPEYIWKKLTEIIELKKNSREKTIIKNIVKTDNYIESFLKNDDDCPKSKRPTSINNLNDELRKILRGKR